MNPLTTQPSAIPPSVSPNDREEAIAGAANEVERRAIHQHLSCTRISVKEAAGRLNRSPSAIYRMDRNSGQFPIMKEGWRVWIELDGFKAFMTRKQIALAGIDSESPASPCIDEAKTLGTKDEQVSTVESTVPAATVTAPEVDLSRIEPLLPAQGSGCGQRELPFNWVYRANWF